ncbi:oxidoreductase family protein [Lentithecium fluviatile CBS 122367]|uniref:Oxidoreductase family protein n=1 Tax=Lentithecium fluviatile CBS 122367 TaxID=1168545 RepID=A0A6G1J5A7_9PLEO|nr:oxidoreductase family protein [Lentithecium fluviatile CBS 122367]
MPPIRVALIGLSSSAKVTWAADAHLPYLLSPTGQKHYLLTALLNSSATAAEAAKHHFKLPSSIKTYGDPAALAADPAIDLVVCCTRVDVHFRTIEPSLRAGKAIFVEWPLTESLARAVELTRGEKLRDSIVGLQGRVSPITLRIKEILATGTIGKVLSSNVRSFGSMLPRDSLPEALTYFADRKVGGNPMNIENGHTLDYIHEVLGEFERFSSRMQIQRPTVKILDAQGKEEGTVETDVPDLLAIHGALKQRDGRMPVAKGALLSVTFRHGPPFKGDPALTWSINGEKGELLVTIGDQYLHSHTIEPIGIKVHDHASDEVKDFTWEWQGWQEELPMRARIIAELYERYAEWVEGGKEIVKEGREWPRVEDAVVRIEQFDRIYKQFDPDWEERT